MRTVSLAITLILAIASGAIRAAEPEDTFEPLLNHAEGVRCGFAVHLNDLVGRPIAPPKPFQGERTPRIKEALRNACRVCVRELGRESQALYQRNTYHFDAKCVVAGCTAGRNETPITVSAALLAQAIQGQLDATHTNRCITR